MNLVPSRTRRRRDRPKPTATVIRGVLVIALASAAMYQLLQLYNGVPTRDYETAFVSVPNVGNLLPHDFVRIGGKRVGQVIDVDLGSDGRPRVELQLDPGTKLPADTTVRIRANGLLGARYIELNPGDERRLLPAGGTIQGGESSYTLGLPEAVDTFDRETRGGMRRTIGVLGAGTLGNGGPLNGTFEVFDDGARDFDRIMRSILSREDAAARLLPSFASAMEPLSRTSGYVRPFTEHAADALQPFVTEREATRAILERAPAALDAARSGLRRGEALLASVRRLSTAADVTLRPAPEGARDLAALLSESRAPLRRLRPTIDVLGPGARSATNVLDTLDPVIPQVQQGLELGRPIMDEVGDHACDVIDTGVTLRSMTGWPQAGDAYDGPNGSAMAFRLQVVAPLADAVGITDPSGLLKKDSYEAPCKYPLREYPQFVPRDALGGRR